MLDNLIAETLPGSADGSLRPYRFDWARELQFPLYKATTRKWFDVLQANDEIYLNTLFDLADEATIGRGIMDKHEGSRQLLYSNGATLGFPMLGNVSAVNSYVFCCASKIDQQLIKVWNAEVVYEIASIDFFKEITQCVRAQSELCIVAPVHYGDWLDGSAGTEQVTRWMDANNSPDSEPNEVIWPSVAYMKDHDLAYQHEVRATWEPPFDLREQRFEELVGVDATAQRNLWDNHRLQILRQQGVRADLQPMPLQVPGIQRFIKEIPLDQIK